ESSLEILKWKRKSKRENRWRIAMKKIMTSLNQSCTVAQRYWKWNSITLMRHPISMNNIAGRRVLP
ncbi:hypothetical protein S83_052088, partial [Arachis hypogaea]